VHRLSHSRCKIHFGSRPLLSPRIKVLHPKMDCVMAEPLQFQTKRTWSAIILKVECKQETNKHDLYRVESIWFWEEIKWNYTFYCKLYFSKLPILFGIHMKLLLDFSAFLFCIIRCVLSRVYNLLLLPAALLLFIWSTAANEFELYFWDNFN